MHLPHRDQDPVQTLYAHYFLAAQLMQEDFEKLDLKRIRRSRLSQNDEVKYGVYFFSWLGFLGVTCEGFRSLKVRLLLQNERPEIFQKLIARSDAIGRLMKRHSDPLREVRNTVFHLRSDLKAINKFFSEGNTRVVWARELSFALEEFFSEYRVTCEVFYLINDRDDESQSHLKKQRKVYSKAAKLRKVSMR